MTRRLWSIGRWLVPVILAVAVGPFLFRARARVDASPENMLTITKGSIVESVYGIGTVTATRSFQLRSGVTNTISQLYVKEGDNLAAGGKLLQLDGVLFRAPFAGTITSLPYRLGETVFASNPILTLTDLSDRYLVVTLTQQAALRVRQGQEARLSFDSARDHTFTGRVESVYSSDTNFLVRIGAVGLPPEFLPGMSADAAISVASRHESLLLPVAALDGHTVWVQSKSGGVSHVNVRLGVVDGAFAEVLEGRLREGDLLLVGRKTGT